MARAISSLPVPVSPTIRTQAREGATWWVTRHDLAHRRARADHAGQAEFVPRAMGVAIKRIGHDAARPSPNEARRPPLPLPARRALSGSGCSVRAGSGE